MPTLGLEAGGRLEPSPELPCTSLFDDMRPAAGAVIDVRFWRCSAETRVRRRNPVWSEATHMSPHRNLAADNLHIFSLGALLYWVNAVLHQLFSDDCFGTRCTTRRERMLGNLRALMALMRRWNQSEAAAGRPRTLPGNFTDGDGRA